MMTVRELIEELEELNPDAEVRIAHQPNYPLWCSVHGISAGTADGQSVYEADNGPIPPEAEYVYITEGSGEGYASRTLWEDQ